MTPAPSRRNVILGATSVAALGLTACFDSEPKQAEAFAAFLKSRLIDRKTAGLPRPNDEERKSFGRFAADYDVILAFNATMNQSVGGKIADVLRRGAFSRVQEIMERREDIATARDAMQTMAKALDGALATATEAKGRMRHPDTLKPVYDQAFDRAITRPAGIMREVFPVIDQVFAQSLDFSDFLTRNKADFQFNGAVAQTSKQQLLQEFNRRAQELNGTGQQLMAAQRSLQDMLRGQ
jgi:CRISPR/Cas system CSM-associated protein Csm2 small subunit